MLLAVFVGCAAPEVDLEPLRSDEEQAPRESFESAPLRQGFTQRPSPDTPGLPPRIEPFLSDEEVHAAREPRKSPSGASVSSLPSDAQSELSELLESYEREPGPSTLEGLLERSREYARAGRIPYLSVAELFAAYLFPNDVSEADRAYKGQLVVLSGAVAPHNMKDFADGFKLVETRPYVHDPLLLATDYELSFVECRLAHPELQRLRDWEPVHLVAEVVGKFRGDVRLARCVILPSEVRSP